MLLERLFMLFPVAFSKQRVDSTVPLPSARDTIDNFQNVNDLPSTSVPTDNVKSRSYHKKRGCYVSDPSIPLGTAEHLFLSNNDASFYPIQCSHPYEKACAFGSSLHKPVSTREFCQPKYRHGCKKFTHNTYTGLCVCALSACASALVTEANQLDCGTRLHSAELQPIRDCPWSNGTGDGGNWFGARAAYMSEDFPADFLLTNNDACTSQQKALSTGKITTTSCHGLFVISSDKDDEYLYTMGKKSSSKLISDIINTQRGIGTLRFSWWANSHMTRLRVCAKIAGIGDVTNTDCQWHKDLFFASEVPQWILESVEVPSLELPFQITFLAMFTDDHLSHLGLDDISYTASISGRGLAMINSGRQNEFPELDDGKSERNVADVPDPQGDIVAAVVKTPSEQFDIPKSDQQVPIVATTIEPLESLGIESTDDIHSLYPDLVPDVSTDRKVSGPAPNATGKSCPPVDCDFDQAKLCQFTNSEKSQTKWKLADGPVGNRVTGINADVSGGGRYLYAEGPAVLVSKPFSVHGGAVLLKFHVHLASAQGRLQICQVTESGTLSPCHTALEHSSDYDFDLASYRNRWNAVYVRLKPGVHQIAFVADNFDHMSSYIGLDDISLVDAAMHMTKTGCVPK